jgi:hypothetical protein
MGGRGRYAESSHGSTLANWSPQAFLITAASDRIEHHKPSCRLDLIDGTLRLLARCAQFRAEGIARL